MHPTFGTDKFPIIATIPVFAGTSQPDHYWLVCATRTDSDGFAEYALAWVRNLSDAQWASGEYSTDLAGLLTRAYLAAGLQYLPWELLAS